MVGSLASERFLIGDCVGASGGNGAALDAVARAGGVDRLDAEECQNLFGVGLADAVDFLLLRKSLGNEGLLAVDVAVEVIFQSLGVERIAVDVDRVAVPFDDEVAVVDTALDGYRLH